MSARDTAGTTGTWPPLTYETLPWRSAYSPGEGSRRARTAHQGPYDAAVVPPIAAASLVLPPEVAAEAEEAAAAIARFDAELGADLAPFTSLLLRSESAASSQIENLTASARAIAEAELDPTGRSNAVQIVANTGAMTAALNLADTLDGDAILAMHDALMTPHDPGISGQWREEQVWIGGGSLGPHHALFVPPHHDRLPAGINDLVAFMARDDLQVLAHAAVAHAQFETLHPFPDGNGRTGRALVHAMLRAKGLTRNVTVPVSAGLLVDVTEYFDALTAYRDGHPEAIVSRFASASFHALTNGRTLVGDLRALREDWQGRITARRDAGVWRVAGLLLRQPAVNGPLLARELAVAPANVYRLINPLVEAGILVESTDKRRGRIWRSPEVLRALDAFAARAGRRVRST